MGATVINHGVVTTPILHHAVLHSNAHHLPPLIPPRPNVVGYYDLLAHSYTALLETAQNHRSKEGASLEPLVVDCACGVGYAHIVRLNEHLQKLGSSARRLLARNAPLDGPLNGGCGSEHVQKDICPPQWYNIDDSTPAKYAASLDGDGDRVVFFTQPQFSLLDGDKIAVLICDFLQEQVSLLKTAMTERGAPMQTELKLGVVQTAYANGASTKYLRSIMGDENVLIAKTGVKHVHETAHCYLDIGVYFEANGHGTVLFGNKFYECMAEADRVVRGHLALRRLQLLPSLVNQAVGDALSDLLLVDSILQLKSWSIHTWDGLYRDMPSRQCKVKVKDRTIIKTNENETKCTSPAALQDSLEEAMETLRGRAFVRPSGTENVVRIYAEAETSQSADALATRAASLVHEFCNGIGEAPSFPSCKM
jgi:phosphoacetylglucosamine mutase